MTNPFSYTTDPYMSFVKALGNLAGVEMSWMVVFFWICVIFVGLVAFGLVLMYRVAKSLMS